MSDINRKLASIRRVDKISPIEGADAIECLTIDGWKVVSQKENFKEGDLCVFFEVDSFLPVEPRFEFLRKSCFRTVEGLGEGFRLKTIKLRGQLSQGLALPIDAFNDVYSGLGIEAGYNEGDDVTELLKVKKWEPPLPKTGGFASGRAISNFPSHIPKTNQERIQNLYKDLYEDTYELTLKVDGTSMTVYFIDENKVGCCSRNFDLDLETPSVYTNALAEFKEQFVFTCISLGKKLAVQGELLGPGIQGNREKLEKVTFYVYDMYDMDKQRYLSPHQRHYITGLMGLKHVPVLHPTPIKISKETHTLDALLSMAEGRSINKDTIREGIVFKKWPDDGTEVHPNFSFKVISNEYLLKEK